MKRARIEIVNHPSMNETLAAAVDADTGEHLCWLGHISYLNAFATANLQGYDLLDQYQFASNGSIIPKEMAPWPEQSS